MEQFDGTLHNSDTIVRDHLAAMRTVLANERTLLAYIRTALAVVAAGACFIKFAETMPAQVLGWLCLPAGAVFLIEGTRRYRRMSAAIAATVPSDSPSLRIG